MYSLKGFVNIEEFILNDSNQISLVGEISTMSLTYSRDVGVYSNPTYPQLTLFAFSSNIDQTGKVTVPELIRDIVLSMSHWLHEKQTSLGAPETREQLLADMTQQFEDQLTGLDLGEMIQTDNGVFFPEWVKWSQTTLPDGHVAEDNEMIIWYADDSFARQYDEFEIVVVPPLADIDQFFTGRNSVYTLMQNRNATEHFNRIQAAKGGQPESVISSEIYHYVNPLNAQDRIPTDWVLLTYGRAGDDSDAAAQAIREYIAGNSTHTENEWRVIFPDIYKTTEFMMLPRWHNYAIPERVLQAGVYSPVVTMSKEIEYLKTCLPNYDADHIEQYAQVFASTYKSLAIALVGSQDNRNSLFELNSVFEDLLNVPTSDTMFEMMSPITREWLLLLTQMLIVAETATTYSDLPVGMRKTTRHGIVYITAKYDNITYLISTKLSTPDYA